MHLYGYGAVHKTSGYYATQVQACGSMVTEEQPHAMLIPLEYFLMGFGLYRPSQFTGSPRSPLSPSCIAPELLSPESMGLKLKPIKTRLTPHQLPTTRRWYMVPELGVNPTSQPTIYRFFFFCCLFFKVSGDSARASGWQGGRYGCRYRKSANSLMDIYREGGRFGFIYCSSGPYKHTILLNCTVNFSRGLLKQNWWMMANSE